MAATRKAATKGYEAVSMRELAETCKLSMTTIYQFCPSKDLLIAEAHVSLMEAFRGDLLNTKLPGATAHQRLRQLMRIYADGLTESASSRTLLRAVYALDPAMAEIRARLGAIAREVYDSALGDSQIPNREAVISTVGHAMDSVVLGWISQHHDAAWVRSELDLIVDVVASGW